MKTYKFKYAKLVRDKIPEFVLASGGKVSQKILSDKNYLIELKRKLIEEIEELAKAKKREDVLDELGDIQEVIDNILKTLKYNSQDLKEIQEKKNKKNGSFLKRIYINHITVDDNYSWLGHHLKNKDKYPLIK